MVDIIRISCHNFENEFQATFECHNIPYCNKCICYSQFGYRYNSYKKCTLFQLTFKHRVVGVSILKFINPMYSLKFSKYDFLLTLFIVNYLLYIRPCDNLVKYFSGFCLQIQEFCMLMKHFPQLFTSTSFSSVFYSCKTIKLFKMKLSTG